jgi:aminoglycoside phosphotransferase (APT) family kinase protein
VVFDDLRAALRAAGFAAEPFDFARVEGGLDNEMWRFSTDDGRDHVLRLYRPGREAGMQREIAAAGAAAAAGLPAPAFEASGQWGERPVAVLPWLPGRQLKDALLGPRLWQLGRSFGATQAAIHRVTPPNALLASNPDRSIDRCGLEHAAIAAAMRAHGLRRDALVHYDYHPLNVLVERGRVTAVLDWLNADAGDPRADLARTAMLLTVPLLPGAAPRSLVRAMLGVLRRAWWRGYIAEAGPIRIPPLFAAWAGAWLLHDVEGRAAESGNPFAERDIAALRRWVRTWSERAGIVA